MPESPRWLMGQGNKAEAEAIVLEIEIAAKQPNHGKYVDATPFHSYKNQNIFLQLFSLVRYYPFQTIFACILDISQAFGGYGVASFVSTSLLPFAKIPESEWALFYFVGTCAAVPGTLFAALFMRIMGRKILLPVAYFVATITAFSMYLALESGNQSLVWLTYALYQFGMLLFI